MIVRTTLRATMLAVATALMVVACGGGGHSSASSQTDQTASIRPIVPTRMTIPPGRRGISGASQARCTPSPCRSPGPPSVFTLTGVSNGDGTASTRQYAVLRPRGLVASPSNRVPAVLTFYAGGNCGPHFGGRWGELSAPHRFIVVGLEASCAINNWRKRNILSPRPTAPSDEPYVTDVVRAIERCPGECVDPKRVYAVGESSGGNMVADVMCDATNSPLFRAFFIDDSTLPVYGGVPDCPTTNVGFFVMMALSNYSADRGLFYGTTIHPHMRVPAFAAWAGHRLRCRGPLIRGQLGTALTYSYTAPCAFATHGVAVMALEVINGGHGWQCQDSDAQATANACPGMSTPPGLGPDGKPQTGGLFMEGTFWKMVSRGRS